jgi:outer membrane translocation and assembly module TamA
MTRKSFSLYSFIPALCLVCPVWASGQTTQAEPLVVQDVTCAGNQSYSCDFIREHLYLRPGAPVDEEEIRNAELRLSALRNFKSVSIRLEKGAQRGDVIVVIQVEEANPVHMEWLLGANLGPNLQYGNTAARVSHHNLFGRGKVGEIRAEAFAPFASDGATAEGYNFSLSYADPQLFGSRRYFGIGSVGLTSNRFEGVDGNFGDFEAAQLSVGVGRRFGDFSYVMLELNYRPSSDWSYGWWNSDPVFHIDEHHGRGTKATLVYGWSTEDDQYFPTQGSALQLAVRRDFGAESPDRYSFLRYRKTWQMLGGYGSFKFGGEPTSEYRAAFAPGQLLSFGYSHPINPGDSIERGRWYVEPGITGFSTSSLGETRIGYGLKAGFRAETRQFGLVELYVIGVAESVQ